MSGSRISKIFTWSPSDSRGGDLLEIIEHCYNKGYRVHERWISIVTGQMFSALAYAHSKDIIHKDVK